jgi:hypothetical protein
MEDESKQWSFDSVLCSRHDFVPLALGVLNEFAKRGQLSQLYDDAKKVVMSKKGLKHDNDD